MSRRRSAFGLAIAIVALVSLGAALAEESLIHTDDGCAVEIHCLACRLAVQSTAVPAPTIVVAVDIATVGEVAPAAALAPRDAERLETPSRAPPLA